MVGRWALVADSVVDNVILWDGQTPWATGPELHVVQLDDEQPAGPGWTYDGTVFAPPPAEPDPET